MLLIECNSFEGLSYNLKLIPYYLYQTHPSRLFGIPLLFVISNTPPLHFGTPHNFVGISIATFISYFLLAKGTVFFYFPGKVQLFPILVQNRVSEWKCCFFFFRCCIFFFLALWIWVSEWILNFSWEKKIHIFFRKQMEKKNTPPKFEKFRKTA